MKLKQKLRSRINSHENLEYIMTVVVDSNILYLVTTNLPYYRAEPSADNSPVKLSYICEYLINPEDVEIIND